MSFVRDLIYPDNPRLRRRVQGLGDSIAGEIKFIERTANDIINRVNNFLNVQQGPVSSDGKQIGAFLLEVRQAFDDLSLKAKEQYRQLSARVNTTVIENIRRQVQGVDLDRMREGIRELELAGVKMKYAVGIFAAVITIDTMMELEALVCLSVRSIGALAAGCLVGALAFVIWEAFAGSTEGKELDRRIKELEKAERTLRDNGTTIANCADELRSALHAIRRGRK